jgi:hypothetical protein
MAHAGTKFVSIAGIVGLLLLLSEPANALRCGSKLVQKGMHESQVIRICGEPVSTRHVGFVLKSYYRSQRSRTSSSLPTYYYGYGYPTELPVTEMLFNFGPRKLMRRLSFEGDRLVRIETAGYGYFDKNQ